MWPSCWSARYGVPILILFALSNVVLSGCDKVTSQVQAASNAIEGLAPSATRPPQTFLDERLVEAGFMNSFLVTPITAAQVDAYFGTTGHWRKIADDTYALDIDGQDELTHKPQHTTLEFKPGQPTAGSCENACSPNEHYLQISRGIFNGDEMSDDDIETLITNVDQAHLPLPAGEVARANAWRQTFNAQAAPVSAGPSAAPSSAPTIPAVTPSDAPDAPPTQTDSQRAASDLAGPVVSAQPPQN